MLQQGRPDDFVIAAGQAYSLEDFVRLSFPAFDFDWRIYVEQSDEFLISTELLISKADSSKAKKYWVRGQL